MSHAKAKHHAQRSKVHAEKARHHAEMAQEYIGQSKKMKEPKVTKKAKKSVKK